MTFTKLARTTAATSWEKSLQHPFIQELQAGTLSDERFRYYLLQDRYYLNQLQDIYLQIATQTVFPEVRQMMLTGSDRLIAGEIAIRETFFKELAITEEEIRQTVIAPGPYHYVSHMYRQLSSKSPNAAFASLLPCAWLYQEIGFHLNQTGSPHPLYQRWIETCITEESVAIVQQEQRLLNAIYEETTKEEQQKMLAAFVISSHMEHEFWETSYRLKTWGNETYGKS
ncbi:thiaminase II [Enterococcus olivae]